LSFLSIGITGISGGGKSTIARTISLVFDEIFGSEIGYIEHDDLYHDRSVVFELQGIKHDENLDPGAKEALKQVTWDRLDNLNYPGTIDAIVAAQRGSVEVPKYIKKTGIHEPREAPIQTRDGLVMEGLFLLSPGYSEFPLYNSKTQAKVSQKDMQEAINAQFDYRILICCEDRKVANQRRIDRDAHMQRSDELTERLIAQADEFYTNCVLQLQVDDPKYFQAEIDCVDTESCIKGIYEFFKLVSQDRGEQDERYKISNPKALKSSIEKHYKAIVEEK
jgi:uridine kinase